MVLITPGTRKYQDPAVLMLPGTKSYQDGNNILGRVCRLT